MDGLPQHMFNSTSPPTTINHKHTTRRTILCVLPTIRPIHRHAVALGSQRVVL